MAKREKPAAPSAEECQAAVLRYQVLAALEVSAGVVAALADRFAEAARAAAAVAEAPKSKLRAAFAAMQHKVDAALAPTGDVVADRFLDGHASLILRRRLRTETFEAHADRPAELAAFAGALDEVADAARRLPVAAGAPRGVALDGLRAWAKEHRVAPAKLARLLADAQLDPPGRRGDRRAAWEAALRAK